MNRRIVLAALSLSGLGALASPVSAQRNAPVPAGALKHGALIIEAAWLREPPGGARIAGGYLRITNTGVTPDRLVSGASSLAGRLELHEMSMTDGVMRMRELARGIELKPGQTVELKPGGLHIMYMDLTAQPKAGEMRKTTLVFEKAGSIEIDFAVMPRSYAPGANKGHAH